MSEGKHQVKTVLLQENLSCSISQNMFQTLDILTDPTAMLNEDGETTCIIFPLSNVAQVLTFSHLEPVSDLSFFGTVVPAMPPKRKLH